MRRQRFVNGTQSTASSGTRSGSWLVKAWPAADSSTGSMSPRRRASGPSSIRTRSW